MEHCPTDCTRACVDCLLRFRNAFFHAHLNRHLATECFQQWGNSIDEEHEIPPLHPQQPASDTGMTVNAAEATLRRMLINAGFPEGEWQRQIKLGRPLGTTTPDCYFEDEDPDEPGLCVYLDGLSEHIHGNAETRDRDQQIREQLRVLGYEVIEIAAGDLHDRDKMKRHLSRMAKLLIGRDGARRIKDNLDWFAEPDADYKHVKDVIPFKKIEPAESDKFKTCIPLLTLKAAAGGFGDSMQVDAQDWVEPGSKRKPGPGMFVAQVVGHSMEPHIPDGAYCLFKSPVVGSRSGRIVLVEHRDIYDPDTGGTYTVKEFDSSEITGKESTTRTGTIYLRPKNPEFESIVLTDIQEDEVRVIAELLEVLG